MSCDDSVAVEQARRHLVPLGHERIGLVLGPSDHVPSQRKLAAARALAQAAGTTVPDEWVARAMFSLEGGQAAAMRLLDQGVTGIICAGDPLALGAIRAARRRGLSVPGDVSVVGYDDSAFMNCTEPPLTTVRQPIEAMGRAAVELLFVQIGGRTVPCDELLFEPELVVRGSLRSPREPLPADRRYSAAYGLSTAVHSLRGGRSRTRQRLRRSRAAERPLGRIRSGRSPYSSSACAIQPAVQDTANTVSPASADMPDETESTASARPTLACRGCGARSW